jgi:hypothetical protein
MSHLLLNLAVGRAAAVGDTDGHAALAVPARPPIMGRAIPVRETKAMKTSKSRKLQPITSDELRTVVGGGADPGGGKIIIISPSFTPAVWS